MENQNQRDDVMNGVLKSNLFPTVGKYNLDGFCMTTFVSFIWVRMTRIMNFKSLVQKCTTNVTQRG